VKLISPTNELSQLDDYSKDKLTIDLEWANIFGLVILIPIGLIFGLPYYFLWRDDLAEASVKSLLDNLSPVSLGLGVLALTGILLGGIILHELIHGLVWAQFAKNGFKSIKFGVMWKMLTPYCHCKEPLKIKHYIMGASMPGILLGIIPASIALFNGNLYLLLFGILFTVSACGDLLIIHLLRKEKMDDLAQDHPSEVGCFIYRKINP
jgi:hypothetical protein